MRIGILGGSFDPIHLEHVRVARLVANKLKLDRLLLIPAFRNPYKSRRLAPPRDRLAMIRLAVRDCPELQAGDLEIRRRGVSYTVDTLRALRTKFPRAELYLIMGSDVLPTLTTWKRPDEIARLATIAVVHRPGTRIASPKVPGLRIRRLPIRGRTISSSEIRRRLAEGKSIDNMVHPEVHAYIMARNLYQS
jgi:nicotinate-nucleotide adenylyltransferase